MIALLVAVYVLVGLPYVFRLIFRDFYGDCYSDDDFTVGWFAFLIFGSLYCSLIAVWVWPLILLSRSINNRTDSGRRLADRLAGHRRNDEKR